MPVIERVGARSPEAGKRTWKRKLFIGLGYLTLVIGGVLLLVLKLTAPMVASFDALLASARDGRTSQAYAFMSADYRRSTGPEAFATLLAKDRFAEVSKTSWSSRKIKGMSDGATGTLEGSLTRRDGSVLPLRVHFVRELGAWRIHSIEQSSASQSSSGTRESR